MLNSRGDKLWAAFWAVLLCWGVVSCGMRVADDTNGPKPDPWANWANYCRQVGGTYVPPPPGLGSNGYLQDPTCLRPDGTPMTFTPGNPEDLDVEPADPTEREWPR